MDILKNKKALERLLHVDSHFKTDWEKNDRRIKLAKRIENVEQNFSMCFLFLQSYCTNSLIHYWFHSQDLSKVRQLCYNYSKLLYARSLPPYECYGQSMAYLDRAFEALWFLVSNHKPLIEWYAQLDKIFPKAADSHKSEQFYTKQCFIALRGEWTLLQERCELVLSEPPKGKGKQFLIDHEFYLALAKGDVDGMMTAINKLLEPRVMGRRKGYESGYTKDLICTPVTLYLKLAWYHGYELEVDNPYIPSEWLPMTPLPEYIDEFDFMKKYPI